MQPPVTVVELPPSTLKGVGNGRSDSKGSRPRVESPIPPPLSHLTTKRSKSRSSRHAQNRAAAQSARTIHKDFGVILLGESAKPCWD